MKLLVLVAVLGACDKLPKAPEAKAFEAMSAEAKCEATMPRAKRCTDELLIAQTRTIEDMDSTGLAEAMREDLGKSPAFSEDAEAVHTYSCLGSRTDEYQRSVLRCWDVTPCKAFAECVYKLPPSPRR